MRQYFIYLKTRKEKAHDLVLREVLYNIVIEFSIHMKLVILIIWVHFIYIFS
jgi:hypothetical protein